MRITTLSSPLQIVVIPIWSKNSLSLSVHSPKKKKNKNSIFNFCSRLHYGSTRYLWFSCVRSCCVDKFRIMMIRQLQILLWMNEDIIIVKLLWWGMNNRRIHVCIQIFFFDESVFVCCQEYRAPYRVRCPEKNCHFFLFPSLSLSPPQTNWLVVPFFRFVFYWLFAFAHTHTHSLN